jgi:hypothetical protein
MLAIGCLREAQAPLDKLMIYVVNDQLAHADKSDRSAYDVPYGCRGQDSKPESLWSLWPHLSRFRGNASHPLLPCG